MTCRKGQREEFIGKVRKKLRERDPFSFGGKYITTVHSGSNLNSTAEAVQKNQNMHAVAFCSEHTQTVRGNKSTGRGKRERERVIIYMQVGVFNQWCTAYSHERRTAQWHRGLQALGTKEILNSCFFLPLLFVLDSVVIFDALTRRSRAVETLLKYVFVSRMLVCFWGTLLQYCNYSELQVCYP